MAIAPKHLKSRNRDSKGKVKYIVKTTKKNKKRIQLLLERKVASIKLLLERKVARFNLGDHEMIHRG